jgi:hypothetical protein
MLEIATAKETLQSIQRLPLVERVQNRDYRDLE